MYGLAVAAIFGSYLQVLSTSSLVGALPESFEPVVFGGPFVMNTQGQIDQAFADYRAGRF